MGTRPPRTPRPHRSMPQEARLPGSTLMLDALPTRPGADAAACAHWHDMSPSDHFVQFYESDGYLLDSVGGFASAGLGDGQSVIVIATSAHRASLDERLRIAGLDPDAAR